MSESISGGAAAGAAGAAAFKAMGGAAGVSAGATGLAAIVVMIMMKPRSTAEWAVALISTVVGSVAGGAAVLRAAGLDARVHRPGGTVRVGVLVRAAGLGGGALDVQLHRAPARQGPGPGGGGSARRGDGGQSWLMPWSPPRSCAPSCRWLARAPTSAHRCMGCGRPL